MLVYCIHWVSVGGEAQEKTDASFSSSAWHPADESASWSPGDGRGDGPCMAHVAEGEHARAGQRGYACAQAHSRVHRRVRVRSGKRTRPGCVKWAWCVADA